MGGDVVGNINPAAVVDRQTRFLLPIKGRPLSAERASHDRAPDSPCPPKRTTKEQTQTTESLPPQNGDAFDNFQPTPEVVAMACELGVGDFETLLENWKDWHRANGKPLPADANASLRLWVRRQTKYSGGGSLPRSRPGRSPPKRPRSNMVQSALDRARRSL